MFLFRKIRTIKRKMMHSPQSNGVVAADRRMIKMPKVGHTTSDGVSLKSLNDSTNSDGSVEVPEQDCEVPFPRSPDSMSLENSMREDHEMETSTSTQDFVIAGKLKDTSKIEVPHKHIESSHNDTEMAIMSKHDVKTTKKIGLPQGDQTDGNSILRGEHVACLREKAFPYSGNQSHNEAPAGETIACQKLKNDKVTDTSTEHRKEGPADDAMDCDGPDRKNNDEIDTDTKMNDVQSDQKKSYKDNCDIPSTTKDVTMEDQNSDQKQDSVPIKNDTGFPSTGKDVPMMDHHCNQEQASDEKKCNSHKNNKAETKEAPKLSQGSTSSHEDSQAKKPDSTESEQKSSIEKRSSFTTSSLLALSLQEKSAVTDTSNNDTSSLYPLDGKWESEWKSFPSNNKKFTVQNHNFQMYDLPCEIIWSSDQGNNNYASFQWPEAVTGKETPVFQQSQFDNIRAIHWQTTDPQYGEIIWKRLDTSGSKAQIVSQQKTDENPMYPLDGVWLLTWKSFYQEPTAFVVKKHRFQLFDYPCDIKLGATDGYFPSFQWPVQVTSFQTPIFQQCKFSIPPDMKETELPGIIKWTVTGDPQYGEVTWTRLRDSSEVSEISDRKRKPLCEEANALMKKRREIEELGMKSSIHGKAWDLVVESMALSSHIEHIDTIAQDDMVYLAERLLMAQEDFKSRGVPSKVDIAYHHTETINLETIKTNGLLSRNEREERNIHSKFNGSACGEGIYCSEDPVRFANQRYGDTTILLARMKGNESRARNTNTCDTSLHHGFCVVKRCNQCVPLFKFPSKFLGTYQHRQRANLDVEETTVNFRERLGDFQKLVQILLDKIFNDHVPTVVNVPWAHRLNALANKSKFATKSKVQSPPAFATFAPARALTVKDMEKSNSIGELEKAIRYNKSQAIVQAAKKRLMTINPGAYSRLQSQMTQTQNRIQPKPFVQSRPSYQGRRKTITYFAPDSLAKTDAIDFCRPYLTHKHLSAQCPMCKIPLMRNGKVVQIAKCGHIFHRNCLEKHMEKNSCCPDCSVPVSNTHWRGTMPSGTMVISQIPSHCAGFDGHNTVMITYMIPNDLQKRYHPLPGSPFISNLKYIAFIPATPEGMKLVKRLKSAFSRGLTFKVGNFNSLVWGITHKISQTEYPDTSYISRCNMELDLLNVPSALDLSLPKSGKAMYGAPQASMSSFATATTAPNKTNFSTGIRNASNQASFFPAQSNDSQVSRPSFLPWAMPAVQTSNPTTTSLTSATEAGANNAKSIPVSWQSSADHPDRWRLIYRICQLLQTQVPDKTQILNRAKTLEGQLYWFAKTKEEYMNPSTVEDRLNKIGVVFFKKG